MQRRLLEGVLVGLLTISFALPAAGVPVADNAHADGDGTPGFPTRLLVYSVDMLASNDAWAVGQTVAPDGVHRPWAGHWNGTTWQHRGTPHRFPGDLDGVDAISRNDVWAVGALRLGRVGGLIEHWDGHGWRRFGHSPSDGALHAVSGDAANDVWAVGFFDQHGLVEHWDGQHWHVIANGLDGGPFPILNDVAAVAPDDVWAVSDTQVFHWDGTAWSTVALPTQGKPTQLRAISMVNGTDGWLVGNATVNSVTVPLSFHWKGTAWKRIVATGLPGDRTFTTVTTLGSDDVWAAGQDPAFSAGSIIVAHWDGDSWHSVAPPSFDRQGVVTGITAVADDDVWMGGYIFNGGYAYLSHWDGSTWTTIP